MGESELIPVNEPYIGEKEIEYVLEAVKSTFISSEGKFIREFEEKFSSFCGRRYGVAVNNGTNALVLAMRALELEEGSEVILPSFTIISCALAVIYNGLIPVFVDSEPETYNIDPEKIEEKITERTKAILMVHTYGHPCEVDKILEIAEKYNLYVIEDFAEAIGSEYKGRKCGSFGVISCTSFYANKLITTGEGGMCLTDDEKLAQKMRRLRNLAFIPEKRFLHYELGFNFRMTNVQAAIGLAQLENASERIEKKIKIARKYSETLKELEDKGILKLPTQKSYAKNTYWMYGIVMKNGVKADIIMKKLEERGVQTRPFFYPLHLQPAFKKFSWFREEKLEVAEFLSEFGFYIPSGLTLNDEKIERICKAFYEVIDEIENKKTIQSKELKIEKNVGKE